jgi:hypothetical protein
MRADAEGLMASAAATATERLPAGARLIGIGWATVDLERAAQEFGLGVRAAPGDAVLGARCAFADAWAGPGGVPIVLLEPDAEGRLAWSLAKLGEGPAVTWWEVDDLDPGIVLGPVVGPFGVARLHREDRRDGRWQFLRPASTATITS